MPNEDIWITIAKQVPALFVMAGIVYLFLKHLGKCNENDKVERAQIVKKFKEMADSCHEVQRDSLKISNAINVRLGETAEIMRENTRVMSKAGEHLENSSNILKRIDARSSGERKTVG